MEIRNSFRKGSFTIEAAGLMGSVLLVIFAVLYGNFYVHNRAWLTAAAYEAALTGSMAAAQEEDAYGAAQLRGQELGNTGFFGLTDLQMQTSTGSTVQIFYQGETASAFGGFASSLQAEGSAKVFKPVEFIRRVRLAKELGEIIKGD